MVICKFHHCHCCHSHCCILFCTLKFVRLPLYLHTLQFPLDFSLIYLIEQMFHNPLELVFAASCLWSQCRCLAFPSFWESAALFFSMSHTDLVLAFAPFFFSSPHHHQDIPHQFSLEMVQAISRRLLLCSVQDKQLKLVAKKEKPQFYSSLW